MKNLILIMTCLIILSCESNVEIWYQKTRDISNGSTENHDKYIEKLTSAFGEPIRIEKADLAFESDIPDLHTTYLYVDFENPEIKSDHDKHHNWKRRDLKGSSGYDNSLEEFRMLTFWADAGHGFNHFEEPDNDKGVISTKYILNPDLGKEYENLSKCRACQRFLQLSEYLTEKGIIYSTSKYNWIKSVKNNHPENYKDFLEARKPELSTLINGEANYNFVQSYNIHDSCESYYFLLEEDYELPRSGFVELKAVGKYVNHAEGTMETEVIYEITDSSREKLMNALNDSDWVYDDLGAIRLNSDRTFSYTTKLFGGFSKRGTWGIDSEGDIFLRPTWSSNGQGLNVNWYSLKSNNSLVNDDDGSVYERN